MSRQIIILGIGLALAPSVAHAQSLIGLRVEGPTEVIEETVTLYSVIAEFDNGWEFDVTLDSFLWVDPGLHADIGVFGDLQAYEVTTDGLETINAIYAFGPDIESATLDVTVRNVGLPGFALGFDGADDVAGLGWDLIPWSTSGTTIEAWFRTTAAGVLIGHQTSLPYGTPSDNVPIIYVGNDGKLRAEYWWGSQSPVTSGQPVNDDLWHHVGIRYENPDFDVWLDGVHVGSRSTTLVGFGVPFFYQVGVGYTVGWPSTNGHWFPFDGLIDEMRFWNIARSEEDIARDMNRTLAGNEAGLVGYWRFDEGQGQYALDSSPYGNDGVLGGDADPAGDTADPQWQLSGAGITNLPVAGHGLVFDGGDHVLVPDSASLSMTSSLTIETWARLNNPGGSWQQLVFKGDTRSGLDPYYLRVDGGQLELGINSDLNELSAAYADALQFDWDHAHHIAGVFADETDQLRIYVDGILQAVSLTALQPLSDQQDMHVRFGKEARNLQHLDGALDEVRIWNVARSGCEIWNNMHRPLRGDEPGLVGYWRFDEGEGQDVLDLTPFGNHGTLGFDSNPGSDDPSWELSGADVGAPPADPIGWTVPEMISEVSSGEDWNVAISGDELEIYIGSERDGFAESELYRAVRPSINDAFSEPVPVWELSIPGYRNHDNVADLSADGLRIYFNRHYWHDPADFFVAERSSPTALWGAPVPIDSLNTAADEYDLAVSADELAAVFTSSRSGQNRYWVASRNSRTEAWGNISLIDSLAGLVPRGCDLAADGLTLYVTADGPGSLGSYDIWQLTRISVDSAFGVPVHMPELSSDVEEWDVSLSGDGGAIYMVSRRIARLRSGNVYISHRLYADESVPGDLDCDGDLDLDDYGLFAPCHTGPDGAVSLACAEADYVSDGYVDLRDFGRFQVLFTGQAP